MKFIKCFFKRFMDEYLKDVIIYSFLFLCVYSVILNIFGYYNKGFVWTTDGLSQHYVTLNYFRDLLLVFKETGHFNTFIWNLGYGMDMFANISYYSLGDFFSYLTIYFKGSLEFFYDYAMGIRLWLVGICFILYCRHRNIKGVGIIIGALMYTFCIRNCHLGISHHYMLNASALFPLLLIGIERSIKDNKNIFLVLISVVTFLQGFYFAYMMFVIAAIYGILFAVFMYKKNFYKTIIMLLKTLLLGVIAMGISACVLYPSIMLFINSSRTVIGYDYSYTIYHFHALATAFSSYSGVYASYIGLIPLFIIGLAVYPFEEKDYSMFITTIFLILALFVSKLGSFLVGFSFPLNRWTFMLCFFLSFMTAGSFKKDFMINHSRMRRILIFSFIFLIPMYIYENPGNLSIISGIICLLLIIILYINNKKNSFPTIRNTLALIVTCLALSYNVYMFFSPIDYSYVKQFDTKLKTDVVLNNNYDGNKEFQKALEEIKKDKSYYNVLKYPSSFYMHNLSLFNNYNSINYYYSINSNNYSILGRDLDNSEYNMSYEIGEFNYRTRITTYLGNKYIITSNPKYVPYNYKLVKEYDESTYLYKNNTTLPFAILYRDKIDLEDYDKLEPFEKEIVLYKTTVVDKDISKFKDFKKYIDKSYFKEKVTLSFNGEAIENKNATVDVHDNSDDVLNIKLKDIKNREVYIKINNIKYNFFNENEIINYNVKDFTQLGIDQYFAKNKWNNYHGDYKISVSSNGKYFAEQFRDPVTSPYYFENNNLFINIGYFDNFKGNINVRFTKKGKYSFDNVEVISVNFNDYKKDIDELKKSNFELKEIKDNYMKATINPTYNGIIQFNTNYSSGWSVYVDGKKVDTFISNKSFLGIEITKGQHNILLKYETPYLKEGISITKASIIIFEFIICIEMVIKRFYFKLKRRK